MTSCLVRYCRCAFAWAAPSVVALCVLTSALPGSASELRRTAEVIAYEKNRPAVVNIHGRKNVRADSNQLVSSDSFRQVNGMGTGIIIDERGYVLTNYHVVEDVSRIQVTMADQRTMVARLINYDPKTDLAVIKMDAEEALPVVAIGTSSDLMVGEPALAIGNAYGYENTLTCGHISALHRTVQVSDEQKYFDLIQTDASINPGNSGGPLMNIDGEVIGINVAVRVGAQNIGFAIPVDEAMEIAAQLLSAETLNGVAHGISGKTVRDDGRCWFEVTEVQAGSAAANAGLQSGDVLTSVEGHRIERRLDIERALIDQPAGGEVEFEFRRDSQAMDARLVLDEVPAGERSIDNRSWDVLGLRLAPIPAATFRQYNSRYRGGLRVVNVRADGPAAKQGIRRGDVLVGMQIWETLSLDNVAYILNRAELDQLDPIKFYILRESETLYGHLRLVTGPTASR